ncbi:MAG: hypothetical protein V4672_22595 [Verrucomicrobiota bacterium]
MSTPDVKPNPAEQVFLNLAYSRFVDLFKEIESEEFWDHDGKYRFSRLRDVFSVYAEMLNYEPIQYILKEIESRRIVESELGKELFQMIRNLIAHFPFYDTWNDIRFTKELITWEGKSRTIDRFCEKFKDREEIKYRIWNPRNENFSYVTIRFPKGYEKNNEISLKDLLDEKEGARFSIRLMLRILLENVEYPQLIVNEIQGS